MALVYPEACPDVASILEAAEACKSEHGRMGVYCCHGNSRFLPSMIEFIFRYAMERRGGPGLPANGLRRLMCEWHLEKYESFCRGRIPEMRGSSSYRVCLLRRRPACHGRG